MTKPSMTKNEPAAEWVDRSALKPWGKNPRKNDEAVKAVVESIKRFGFGAPILARREDGEVIAGHTRLKAAEALGIDRVPVRYLDLDPADAHLLALADNKLNEKAEWDNAAVASILSDYGLDDAALAGWDSAELDKIAAELAPEPTDVDAEPKVDQAEELRVKWGVETGQLWKLGEHRILCGDSTKAEDVARVMGGEKADLIWTDPPYGVDHVGGSKDPRDKKNHRSGGVVHNDDKTGADLVSLISRAVGSIPRTESAACYMASPAGSPLVTMIEAFNASGFVFRHSLVWVKDAFVFGRCDYHYRHEIILYGWRDRREWTGSRDQSSVFEFPKGDRAVPHPTSKPVELVAAMLGNHPVGIVAEPFSGSGTTLIACEQTGRRCRAIEISPAYVAVAIQRWADATGGTPERL